MLFSPKRIGVGARSEMQSTTELLIRQGLDKYLGQHIEVVRVAVSSADDIADSAIQVLVEYKLRETQSAETIVLQMG